MLRFAPLFLRTKSFSVSQTKVFKARHGAKKAPKTQGYLIPLSFVRCLVPRAGLEPSMFKGKGPQKDTRNSRVSDTLEFLVRFGGPGGP